MIFGTERKVYLTLDNNNWASANVKSHFDFTNLKENDKMTLLICKNEGNSCGYEQYDITGSITYNDGHVQVLSSKQARQIKLNL